MNSTSRLLAIALLVFTGTWTVVAQHRKPAAIGGTVFVVDPTKPYVYLELDHIGPRHPKFVGEPDRGIYLRVRNNCRVPIIIWTFAVPWAQPGESGVMDEVVPNTPPHQGEPIAEHIYTIPKSSGLSGLPDAVLTSEAKKDRDQHLKQEQISGGEQASGKKEAIVDRGAGLPQGYMYHLKTGTVLAPGEGLYFSLPINHVGEDWHVEIPFHFALPETSPLRTPASFLSLYKEDLQTVGAPR